MIAASLLAWSIAVPLVVAVIALRRAERRERAARRDLTADCASLLEDPRIEVDAAGYGVLKGRWRGETVALRPFADTLALRRLPQLWLAVTVGRDAPAGASGPTLELVRRPAGVEHYAAGGALPLGVAPPPGWPADTQVRGSRDAAALLARLAGPLAGALGEPKVKSVLVSPRGVRVVWQAAQGERGAYLLFRDARFRTGKIAPSDALAALELARSALDARDADAPQDELHEAAA